ncbi:MAG: acylglycerol kinase family protein [Anaerolineales bacterium]
MSINPEADRGRSCRMAGDLHQLSREWGDAGRIGTDYPRHACELASAATETDYETVVALGGDGTVHEADTGIRKVEPARRPRRGMVPLRPGNNFAGGMGVVV